jgi:hypothetical protein
MHNLATLLRSLEGGRASSGVMGAGGRETEGSMLKEVTPTMSFLKKLFGIKCDECKKRKPYTEFMEVPMVGGTKYICKTCYPKFSASCINLY